MCAKDLLLVRFSRFGHLKAFWYALDVRFARIGHPGEAERANFRNCP